MERLKDIEEEISVTLLVRSLAQTYEEAATMEMKKIRDSVLTKRDFLLRILELYMQVKVNYKEEIDKLAKSKNPFFTFIKKKEINPKNSFVTINKSNKSAIVLLTTNRTMVGPVNFKVFQTFFEAAEKDTTSEIIVIGRIGKRYMSAFLPDRKYKYFEFTKNLSDPTELANIAKELIEYEKIDVYHGKFLNLINQVGVKSSVSGELETAEEVAPSDEEARYKFEPSIKEVINFFETQIFSSLFSQTVSETNLANEGSRIQAMEQTVSGAEDYLKTLQRRKIRAKKILEGKKQKERIIASMIINKGVAV